MPDVKIVQSFVQGTLGWTEVWHRAQAGNDLNVTLNHWLTNVLPARMKLSGQQTQAQYTRVSYVNPPRASVLQAVLASDYPPYAAESDTPTTVLLFRGRDVTAQYGKTWFVRGVPDVCVSAGGTYTPSILYMALVVSYIQKLSTGGYGWLARSKVPKLGFLTAVNQNPDNTVTFTCPNLFQGAGPPWPRVILNLSRLVGNPQLAGPVVVQLVDKDTAVSTVPIAITADPTSGNARWNTTSLIGLSQGGVERVGRRDTGRPILQPRGRQRARKRG